MRKTLLFILLVAYLGILFYLTLVAHTTVPLPPDGRLRLAPFETVVIYLHKGGWEMLVNVVGNLAAFVPLGFLWPLLRDDRTTGWRVALVAAGLSLLIESLQYVSGYRVADIDDIVLNTLGGLIGYGVYRLVRTAVSLAGPATSKRSFMET